MPSCNNRKKFGFKNKKELQNEAHTSKTNVHKATASKKLLVSTKTDTAPQTALLSKLGLCNYGYARDLQAKYDSSVRRRRHTENK